MSEENFSKLPFRVSLLGDTALLSFAEAIAIAVGLVSQVILTRGLSAEEFGTWIVIFDVGLTLFLLADPGLSTVIGRELPSNPQLSSPFLFSIMKLQISLIFITMLFAVAFFQLFTNPFDFPIIPLTLLFMGAMSFASSLVYKAFLRSLGKANWEATMRVIDRILLAGGYLFVYEANGELGEYCLVLCFVPIMTTLSLSILCIKLASSLSKNLESVNDSSFTSLSLLRRSLPYFAFIGMLQVLDRLDKLLLYIHRPSEHIATYGISLLVFFTGMAVNRIIRNIMLPWFTETKNLPPASIIARFKVAFMFVALLVPIGIIVAQLVMMTIPLVVFPEEFVTPNHGYFSSESIFRILLVTWSINMLCSPSWESIRAFSSPSKLNIVTFSGLVVALLFGLFSVSRWGVYGAAMMTTTAPITFLISSHIMMPEVLRRELDKDYFQTLVIMTLISFSPLIFFLEIISPLSGFLILLILALPSSLLIYDYWNRSKDTILPYISSSR